ncbi:MAG: adenosylmethionine decarboxylase [Pseudomonadota bacterium]
MLRAALGTHWVADAYGCDRQLLNAEGVELALIEIPEVLGLRRVSEPQVSRHADGSVAGVVLIAESHMSLHGFPATGGLHVDLFSCAPFDLPVLRSELTERFRALAFEETLIDRGIPV